MTALELNGVWSPPLAALSATFGAGLHVVLGGARDGTSDLIAIVTGSRLPRRGSLTISGAVPARSPALRRRIASLLANEAPSGPADVAGWCSEVGALKGFDAARSVAAYCPGVKRERQLTSLSLSECRQLALAVALGQPEPALVALHEPLSCMPAPFFAAVLARIQELGKETIVLCTASRVSDARQLGGYLYLLERGVLARNVVSTWPQAITPGLPAELWIDCSSPRELLRELLGSPDVLRASIDGERLRVGGPDLERLCEAVARAALNTHAGVRALGAASPDLSVVHAASAGLASAAYQAAQRRVASGVIGSAIGPEPASASPSPPDGSGSA